MTSIKLFNMHALVLSKVTIWLLMDIILIIYCLHYDYSYCCSDLKFKIICLRFRKKYVVHLSLTRGYNKVCYGFYSLCLLVILFIEYSLFIHCYCILEF